MADDEQPQQEPSNDPAPQQDPQPAPQPAPQQQGGFDLGTVIDQAKQVITDPTGFYRAMPKDGGYSEPVIFGLVMGALTGVVFGVLSIIGLTGAGAAGFGAIIVVPIGVLIGGFIAGAILFVIWKLMGSPESYQTAYRCVVYSYAIMPVLAIFSIIPYIGTIVRVAWGTWLMIIARVEVHGRARQTANIVFGILAALLLVTGLSGERAQRNMEAVMEEKAEQFEEQFQSLEQLGIGEDGQIDPEKAGRAVGDFIRGMQEAAEGIEQEADKEE